ncbi:unnamed protein product [Mycetohabitans rhizoxinica HKI 454]|uniref:Uncharacterized protein n=1 Tax=Mycetohabitans rhizoxinica (strain DSM 19002 / CIP 109453 / HKI 454) TaxID=882378 RepID=E5AQA3_MYCRK|nr:MULTISPECIES: hypothetical protein [Mycetohabitans]MCG1046871.1 hypothetical protein [Mycetohabitans sp. B6]CBW74785.1 unnamed protein product [Mycetohabitans rhizoxinica HKI 454]
MACTGHRRERERGVDLFRHGQRCITLKQAAGLRATHRTASATCGDCVGAGNDAVIALQRAARLPLGDMQRGFIRDYAVTGQSINAAAAGRRLSLLK